MDWKIYSKDRLFAQHQSGFFIIKPLEDVDTKQQPFFCPVCDFVMKSTYDAEAWEKFNCCDKCASIWAYPDMARWKSGWRPTKEEVENKTQHNWK